ncbi:MAG TPA: STAS domain-containing protein [Gemmataceae bacterium]
MRLTLISHTDQVTRLECEGEITQYALPKERDAFEDLLGPAIYRRQVLLNMEKTPYTDSSGISWLIGSHKRFERDGGRLIIHSVPPAVGQVLRLLKLNTLLHVAADEAEAVQRAGGAQVS